MFNLKSVVAGLTALGLTLGLAGGIKPAEAVQLDDGGSKKEPLNIYLHGISVAETSQPYYSLAPLVSTLSGYSLKGNSNYVKATALGFKPSAKETKKINSEMFYFAGQQSTYYAYYSKKYKGDGVHLWRAYNDMNDSYNKNATGKTTEKGVEVLFPQDLASLDAQVKMLKAVIEAESSNRKVNLIGHSMGGLTAVAYAHKYGTNVNKVVTIDSPLEGSDTLISQKNTFLTPEAIVDLKPGSNALKKLYGKDRLLSKNISVLSLVSKGSWVVTESSSTALKKYTKRDKFSYKQKIIKGVDHSTILKSKTALKEIKSFLNN